MHICYTTILSLAFINAVRKETIYLHDNEIIFK